MLIRYLLLSCFIFYSISFASPSNSNGLEKVSLQLYWKYQFKFAGFIAAKEKGFYQDAGLDVELKEYKNGINIEKNVLIGKSQYGIYNSFALLEYLREKPIKLISSYFKRPSLVSLTKSNIHSTKDLITKKKFYTVQMELITSNSEVLNHPKRVEAFKEASTLGWKYALSHKDELVNIIYDKYSKNITKNELRDEANEIEKLILPLTYDIGSIDINFLHKQLTLFQEYYKIGQNKEIYDYIFNYDGIGFTKNELDYIENNKEIKVCINQGMFPIDGYFNGELVGIMSDIFELISNKTSITFIPIGASSEEQLMQNLYTKKCKLLSIVSIKNKKFKTIVKTKPFISTHFTLLSTLDKAFVHSPKTLKNKLLFVQKDSFKDYLKYLYPYLKIEVEYDKDKIIKKLLDGKIYAIVTLDEQADYFIGKYGYGKLKIDGFLAKKHPIEGGIGVQENEHILYSIMQKSISIISKDKIQAIKNSWKISRRVNKGIDYTLIFKIFGGMAIVFLAMLYYYKKLQNFNKKLELLVEEKTKALREINDYLEDTVAQKVEELIKKDEILTSQSKQAVMGEMISMIAHQWRQPLNTITLNISNIQIKHMMGKEIDSKELSNALDDISNTIIYLSDTIDDFKTYFHPDKKTALVLLDDLIEKAASFVSLKLKSKNIYFEHIKSEGIEIVVYANELVQVLLNILNNAIDAYDKIDDSNKKISITTQLYDAEVYIYVEDRAGGVKKEYIKHLFEPYFSTKGKNGTGLGLYMSQMIIEKQFKGEIYLNTSQDGTTFIIKIPTSLQL